jgi:hypothetical protein
VVGLIRRGVATSSLRMSMSRPVSGPPQTVSALRSLLAARFPEKAPEGGRRGGGGHARSLDEALGGGLPAGRLTELVSAVPSSRRPDGRRPASSPPRRRPASGSRSSTRADGFAPDAVDARPPAPPGLGRAASSPEQAFAVADILVRDGNYAVLVLDLRGCAERALRRTPASTWYRLQRAAEGGSVAVLVQTTIPLVPAVPWRLVLGASLLSLAGTDAAAGGRGRTGLAVQTPSGATAAVTSRRLTG